MSRTTSERAFPGTAAQIGEARHWTERRLADAGVPSGIAADAVLCVSELATNAIRYTLSGIDGGRFRLRVIVTAGVLIQVEVRDEGPLPDPPAAGDEGGRVLPIVRALCDECGVGTGGLSWFRLPLTATVPGPAPSPEEAGALW
jgi:serine/threonine-protein kinase RsbW